MILLGAVVLVTVYTLVATGASGGGPRRLWLTAASALALIVALAGLVGWIYAVPSVLRLVGYALGFTAPVVLAPTLLLSWRAAAELARGPRLAAAVLAGCAGLVAGFVVVVFGLGVW
jgi:hypothetical protein